VSVRTIDTQPRVFLLVITVLLALFPLTGAGFYTELLAKVLIMAIFAMSLDLLVGVTGLVSLGHAAFFGVAAYTVAFVTPKYEAASLWVALPASVLAAAFAALVIGLFVLRTKGIYFIMVTLAFAQLVYFLFHDTDLGGGSDGIYVNFKPEPRIGSFMPFDLGNFLHFYYFVLVVLVVAYLFLRRVLISPFGRTLAGIRSNEHRMRSLGYPVYLYKLAAFVLAGAIAGVAGFLAACQFGFVNPELLSWHHSANALLMVILGGMGGLWGAALGAFAFVLLQEIFSTLTKHWQLLLGGVILVAVLFLPGGLVTLPARIRQRVFGRPADE
jgi:branched-chain amino acid transport system permease protein